MSRSSRHNFATCGSIDSFRVRNNAACSAGAGSLPQRRRHDVLPHAAAAIPIYGAAAGVLLHVTWNVGPQGAPKLRAHLATHVLLLDDAAGDAIAGIAGWVGGVVVLGGVDHHGSATLLEDRVRFALFQGDVLVHDLERQVSVGRNSNIVHVAGVMAFRVELAVFFLRGIEMGTGRGEGRLALADRVYVQRALARRQAFERPAEPYAVTG